MASLGSVSPGAATDGVTPIFLFKKLANVLVIATKWWPFLAVVSSQLHNSHLPTSCCPVFFVNSATEFFSFGCHPLDGVTRGRPSPFPLVTPVRRGTGDVWVNFPSSAYHQTSGYILLTGRLSAVRQIRVSVSNKERNTTRIPSDCHRMMGTALKCNKNKCAQRTLWISTRLLLPAAVYFIHCQQPLLVYFAASSRHDWNGVSGRG